MAGTDKVEAYADACRTLYARSIGTTEAHIWMQREEALIEIHWGDRLAWIAWVEKQAQEGKMQWCVDLVTEAVTTRLTQ